MHAATTPITADAAPWRLVVRQSAGPARTLSLFSYTAGFGASAVAEGSIPTPGDAAGALTVGAVKWTGTALEPYSSQGAAGTTAKPDVVGPTYVTSNPEWPGTAGTSAATAHVAGAAVLLRQARLARGLPVSPADLRAQLTGTALGLGAAGPDPLYGAGMARIDATAPGAVGAHRPRDAPARARPRRRRGYDPPRAHLDERARPAGGPPPGGGGAAAGAAARREPRDDRRRGHGGERRQRAPASCGGRDEAPRRHPRRRRGRRGPVGRRRRRGCRRRGARCSIAVDARPGKVAAATAALRRGGLEVQRRRGRRLQVVADPRRASALARLPVVAGARPATTAFADDGRSSARGSSAAARTCSGGSPTAAPASRSRCSTSASARTSAACRGSASCRRRSGSRRCRSTPRAGSPAPTPTATAPTTASSSPRRSSTTRPPPATCSSTTTPTPTSWRRPTRSSRAGPTSSSTPTASSRDPSTAPARRRAPSTAPPRRASSGSTPPATTPGCTGAARWSDADADDDLDWPNGDNWTFPRGAGLPITFALSWPAPASGPPDRPRPGARAAGRRRRLERGRDVDRPPVAGRAARRAHRRLLAAGRRRLPAARRADLGSGAGRAT